MGKIFAAVALLAAVAPMLMSPVFKKLYNATLSSFPAAFLLVAAGLYCVSVALNFYLWLARKNIKGTAEEDESNNNDSNNNNNVEIKATDEKDEQKKNAEAIVNNNNEIVESQKTRN